MNCKHCGSPYTEPRGKTESFEKTTYNYYCQSCKRTFTNEVSKNAADGEWLMTIQQAKWGGLNSGGKVDRYAEIYKKANGVVFINQFAEEKYKTRTVTPKFKVNHNQYTHEYNLWLDTFTYFNDSDGTYIDTERILLNEELAERAKDSPAMKAIHIRDNIYGTKSSTSTTLLNDVASWLRSQFYDPNAPQTSSGSSGGCYVATAVYGSYDCPQVWTLRRYRDYTLAKTWYGRAFIRTYYAISPALVKWFGKTNWFKKLWQGKLDRMVARLQAEGIESTPYEDRGW